MHSLIFDSDLVIITKIMMILLEESRFLDFSIFFFFLKQNFNDAN